VATSGINPSGAGAPERALRDGSTTANSSCATTAFLTEPSPVGKHSIRRLGVKSFGDEDLSWQLMPEVPGMQEASVCVGVGAGFRCRLNRAR
jgi:hypothetical protein